MTVVAVIGVKYLPRDFKEKLLQNWKFWNKMWPLFIRSLRTYAPQIMLPFAALIGIIGYNLENLLSDKYTPYNASIKESRDDRLLSDESLASAANVEKLRYKANVLGTNVSPSLE